MSTSHGEPDPAMKEARDADMERVQLNPSSRKERIKNCLGLGRPFAGGHYKLKPCSHISHQNCSS